MFVYITPNYFKAYELQAVRMDILVNGSYWLFTVTWKQIKATQQPRLKFGFSRFVLCIDIRMEFFQKVEVEQDFEIQITLSARYFIANLEHVFSAWIRLDDELCESIFPICVSSFVQTIHWDKSKPLSISTVFSLSKCLMTHYPCTA